MASLSKVNAVICTQALSNLLNPLHIPITVEEDVSLIWPSGSIYLKHKKDILPNMVQFARWWAHLF